jgi:hypothetical protein
MRNRFKVLGIVFLAAFLAFSMTGCPDSDDNTGNGNNNDDGGKVSITVNETSGELTITGLDDYNGKWALAMAENPVLIAAVDVDGDNIICGKITNGSVTLKLWKGDGDEKNVTLNNYTGNDKKVAVGLYILKTSELNINDMNEDSIAAFWIGYGMIYVDFTRGEGTGEYTGTLPPTEGELILTGLDKYNGRYVYAVADTDDFFMLAAIDMDIINSAPVSGEVSDGSVTLKVWKITTDTIDSYTGDDENINFSIIIQNAITIINTASVTVDFTGGKGTAKVENFTLP